MKETNIYIYIYLFVLNKAWNWNNPKIFKPVLQKVDDNKTDRDKVWHEDQKQLDLHI